MMFESFTAFVLMGGHGAYIWAAYAITLVVIGVNLWWPRRERRNFVRAEKATGLRQTGPSP